MPQPVLTCASEVVQLLTSVDDDFEGGIWCCHVGRYTSAYGIRKCCVYSFKKVRKNAKNTGDRYGLKIILKVGNSRMMWDSEFNEDILLKNFTRMSKTFMRFWGLCSQWLQNRILLLRHTSLFSTPFNMFKACAIECVTFVKRMRHTSALNASKSARVWT
jgi:hypothetical protein